MLRFKLDLSAYNGLYSKPVWRVERHAIKHATMLDYAHDIFASYDIHGRNPMIYMDGAIIDECESPDIIRDGDLLVFVPRAGSSKRSIQTRMPESERRSSTGQAPENGTNSPNICLSFREEISQTDFVDARHSSNAMEEEEEETAAHDEAKIGDQAEVEVSTERSSRKKRKRGPRRRGRTRHMILGPNYFFERHTFVDAMEGAGSTETLASGRSAPNPSKKAGRGQSTPKPVATPCKKGKNSTLFKNKSISRLPRKKHCSPCPNAASGSGDFVTSNSSQTSMMSSAMTATTSTPVERKPKRSEDVDSGHASSCGLSARSKPVLKMSARKMAKRAFGVGHVLQMLRHNEKDHIAEGKGVASPKSVAEDGTRSPPCTADKRLKQSKQGHSLNNQQHEKRLQEVEEKITVAGKGDNPTKSAVNFDDVEVGSRLQAGVTLFSETDLCTKYFADVTMTVTQKNTAKKQLFMVHQSGHLPNEFRKDPFKVDWAMLEEVKLL